MSHAAYRHKCLATVGIFKNELDTTNVWVRRLKAMRGMDWKSISDGWMWPREIQAARWRELGRTRLRAEDSSTFTEHLLCPRPSGKFNRKFTSFLIYRLLWPKNQTVNIQNMKSNRCHGNKWTITQLQTSGDGESSDGLGRLHREKSWNLKFRARPAANCVINDDADFPHLPNNRQVNKDKQTWEWPHTHSHTHTHHCLSTCKRHKGSMTQLNERLVLYINPLLANLPPPLSPRLDSQAPGNYRSICISVDTFITSPDTCSHPSIPPFISSIAPVLSWLHNPCTEGPNIFSVKLRRLCRTIFIFWWEAGVTKCC